MVGQGGTCNFCDTKVVRDRGRGRCGVVLRHFLCIKGHINDDIFDILLICLAIFGISRGML